MRAVVTGGAGFIGRSLVRQLRARGDSVVALVRNATRAEALRELGCELVEGDLAAMPADALRATLDGAEALFHLAGSYRIGIPTTEHAAMHQANVGATRAVLDAVIAAGVPRIVYVSTANVYGDPAAGWWTRRTGARSRQNSCPTTTRRSTSPTSPPKSGSTAGRRS